MMHFGLSREDTQDNKHCKTKSKPDNPGLHEKWLLKRCLHMYADVA